jgi:general secretion pathway protein D
MNVTQEIARSKHNMAPEARHRPMFTKMFRQAAIPAMAFVLTLAGGVAELQGQPAEPAATQPVPTEVGPPATQPVTTEVESAATHPVPAGVEPPTTQPVTAGAEPPTTQPVTAGVEPPTTQPATAGVEPPTTQPATTQPGPATTQAATTRPAINPDTPIWINFKDTPLIAVLEHLSEVAGLVVVQEARVDGKVTIVSRQPLSLEDAMSLLDTVLKQKGYAAIRSGRVLRIVALDQAKKDLLQVRSGNDPEAIRTSDRMMTHVIPVRFVDAVKLRTDLAALIPPYADLQANAASNTLILTSTEASIRRIVEIVLAIDQRSSEVSQVKVFQLKYANAAGAARLIADLFREDRTAQGQAAGRRFSLRDVMRGRSEPQAQAESSDRRTVKVTASADERTNTLVVSAPSDVMKVIEGLVQELDSNPAILQLAQVKVFQLKYANATSAARLIADLFKEDKPVQGQPASSGRRSFSLPDILGGRSGPQAGANDSGILKVTASADERTNTLVISAPPDIMKVIEGLVQELDSNPSAEEAVFIYPLKNAKAGKLQALLNDLFGWTSRTTSTGGAVRQTPAAPAAGRTGTTGARTSGSTRQMGTLARAAPATPSAAATPAGQARGPAIASGTATDLAGQVYVVADVDTNSLLVMTASANFERVKAILAELDRAVPQVLIKVLIAEVTHDESLDVGAEFSVLNIRSGGKGYTVGTDFSVAAQTGGLVLKLMESDVTAAIRAIAGTAKLDVLSRPYILTSDNQTASITVGQEVPFIRNTRTTETGQTINTIEYEDIGIIVSVTPHINPEGLVIMDVSPEISTITGDTVPISETVSAPVFAKRSAQTRVAVPDGHTIVIGGLMEDRLTDNIKKVPILGDIPLLGELFKRKVQNKTKTELLIFLTPHVAKQPEDLQPMSKDEQAGTKQTRKAVEEGAFEEHMEGMQRGATSRPAAIEDKSPNKETKDESNQPDLPGGAGGD